MNTWIQFILPYLTPETLIASVVLATLLMVIAELGRSAGNNTPRLKPS